MVKSKRVLKRGEVYWVEPDSADPAVGHEIQKRRPGVILADPEVLEQQKYPMTAVVPTSSQGQPAGSLYVPVAMRPSGLSTPSWALCDQVRSIDVDRLGRRLGQVSDQELLSIADGVTLFLGLFDPTDE